MSRIVAWLVVLPLFIAVVIFAANNNGRVDLDLWPVTEEVLAFPIYGLVFAGLFIGFVLGGVVAWSQGSAQRHRLRDLARSHEADRRELARLADQRSRLAAADRSSAGAPPPEIAAGRPEQVSSEAR